MQRIVPWWHQNVLLIIMTIISFSFFLFRSPYDSPGRRAVRFKQHQTHFNPLISAYPLLFLLPGTFFGGGRID